MAAHQVQTGTSEWHPHLDDDHIMLLINQMNPILLRLPGAALATELNFRRKFCSAIRAVPFAGHRRSALTAEFHTSLELCTALPALCRGRNSGRRRTRRRSRLCNSRALSRAGGRPARLRSPCARQPAEHTAKYFAEAALGKKLLGSFLVLLLLQLSFALFLRLALLVLWVEARDLHICQSLLYLAQCVLGSLLHFREVVAKLFVPFSGKSCGHIRQDDLAAFLILT
jgi:hypothetical protein